MGSKAVSHEYVSALGRYWQAEVHVGSYVEGVCYHKHRTEADAKKCAVSMKNEWDSEQDDDHVFTPAEQQLSVRFDCRPRPG